MTLSRSIAKMQIWTVFLLETDSSIPNAHHHALEFLAVTYLIEDMDAEETIAYFSVLNDKIEREITIRQHGIDYLVNYQT